MRGARLALPLLLFVLFPTESAWAQTTGNQAGLIVVHGDGRVTTRCIAFSEPQISGSDLVFRSGLSLISTVGPLGVTICSLNGEGCPSSDCFCECHSTPCVYWVYYNSSRDGAWTYSNIGAVSRQISSGDVDAWVWGEASTLPPSLTFDAICGQAEAVAGSPPAQETPDPSSTPESVRTAAPTLTETPTAEVTATSTISPTLEATSPAAAKVSTPTPTVTSSPTAIPTPVTAPLASPDDGAVTTEASVQPAEPSQLVAPEPSGSSVQGLLGQILSFVAVLSVAGGAFALFSRRSGPK